LLPVSRFESVWLLMLFDIRLFGAIEIHYDGTLLTGFRSQKALVLLAYLLCEDRALTRDYLAGLGWPESNQSQALGLLRRSLHDLHHQLPGCLDLDRRTVRFQPDAPILVDVQQFRALAAQPDVASWRAAVALYRAPFLQGIYVDDAPELESWLLRQQEHWQGEMSRLLKRLADQLCEDGDYALALHATQQLLALEPWREEAHRQAMVLLARMGQNSAALAQYETCRRVLLAELDVEPAYETKRLRARLVAIAQMPTSSLPVTTTPFVGRTEQVAELTALLARRDGRLITLLGPGGMGKTRLALEVARNVATAQQRRFLHGVRFVPLVGVETLSQLVAALGHALAFSFQPQSAPDFQLLHYLHDKELLLLLDNVEQLVNEPVALFVRQLLDRAPDIKLLVTSRVRLHLQGEQLYWMQGLAVPMNTTKTTDPSVAELATYSSVQLFLATVQRNRADYALSAADASVVMTICQMVQGMPLAIELAATWLSVLTPTEIAASLAHNLDFLASDTHDLPLRQRSMRAVFETSWRLLTAAEQRAFSRLAVFRGGFTSEAAHHVANAPASILVGLINHSLVSQIGMGRFELHELLRQYAHEKLIATGLLLVTQRDHAAYFVRLVEQAEIYLWQADQQDWITKLKEDHANILAAITCSLTVEDLEIALRLLGSIWWFWELHGCPLEIEDCYEYVLILVERKWAVDSNNPIEILESHDSYKIDLYGKVLFAAGVMNGFCRSNIPVGTGYFEQYLALERSKTPTLLSIQVRHYFGCLRLVQGSYKQGDRLLNESLAFLSNMSALSREAHTALWGRIMFELCMSAFIQADLDRSQSLGEQTLPLLEEASNHYTAAWVKGLLGATALYKGELEHASSLLHQALSAFRVLHATIGIYRILCELGVLHLRQEDWRGAHICFAEGLGMQFEGELLTLVDHLRGMAAIAVHQKQAGVAATLLGAINTLIKDRQLTIPPVYRPDYNAIFATTRAALDATSFASAYDLGCRMTSVQAIAFALRVD